MNAKPKLSITYCTQCNWLLRAAWMAQEVLSTFSLEMGEVTMIPGTGGIFQIRLDDALIWDRSSRWSATASIPAATSATSIARMARRRTNP
jgi:selT/selW/selH-like putative selenoprotein